MSANDNNQNVNGQNDEIQDDESDKEIRSGRFQNRHSPAGSDQHRRISPLFLSLKLTAAPKAPTVDCGKIDEYDANHKALFNHSHLELIHSRFYGPIGTRDKSSGRNPFHKAISYQIDHEEQTEYQN
ncbi:hypothetical protein [Parasitella parasitica]|uniref:Uncharacterized protein n=1 Tax=Parasitella parasitica TaxID=35722 RepID=A0A0B7MV07_9FUNG|nr:hypothetical protein [Parasitella parasitica]